MPLPSWARVSPEGHPLSRPPLERPPAACTSLSRPPASAPLAAAWPADRRGPASSPPLACPDRRAAFLSAVRLARPAPQTCRVAGRGAWREKRLAGATRGGLQLLPVNPPEAPFRFLSPLYEAWELVVSHNSALSVCLGVAGSSCQSIRPRVLAGLSFWEAWPTRGPAGTPDVQEGAHLIWEF